MICDLAAAGTTMLVVSHAMSFSARLSTRVVLLDHGVVVQAALFGARAKPRLRSFLQTYLDRVACAGRLRTQNTRPAKAGRAS